MVVQNQTQNDEKKKPDWPIVERPIIFFPAKVKQKLDAYIASVPGEIAGMGTVRLYGPNRFIVEDVFIFKQEVSAGEAELDQEDLSKFLLECVQNGTDASNVKLQWHSHGNMTTFWSKQTDLVNIENFDNGMNDWMLSIVGNRSGNYLGRLDIFRPVRVYLDNLDFRIITEVDETLRSQIAAEVAEKVRTKVYTVTKKVGSRRKKIRLLGLGGQNVNS